MSIGGIEILLIFFALVIGLGGMVFWIWMLIDCATKESNEGNEKIAWIVIIAVTQIIGALIYLIIRRPKRIRELGR